MSSASICLRGPRRMRGKTVPPKRRGRRARNVATFESSITHNPGQPSKEPHALPYGLGSTFTAVKTMALQVPTLKVRFRLGLTKA